MHPPDDHRKGIGASKRNDNKILLIWIVILVTLTALGAFLWYRFLRADNRPAPAATLNVSSVDVGKLNVSEKQAYEATQKFFDNVKSQNNTEAFNLFSDVLKNQYKGGVSDFASSVQNANLQNIKQWAITNIETNGNKDRIIVKGSAVFNTPNPQAKFEFSFYKDTEGNFKLYSWQVYPQA